ncbi:glycosyltransferase [Streptomyces sp. NPDC057877]|uniref:glycosyltransferase n=1 Tax=Streptomyces sp. NPDC057877 TaxID=3346269 RepID=UPI0036BF395E
MIQVSVVVPVYNAGPYLDRCAPSLLRQTLGQRSYEVIYVDDGSTDDSGRRLDELAARHPHVRVVHQENSGWPGKPRNVGVRAARGEYVQFVDQDDELTPDALERLLALASRRGSDIVLGKVTGTMQGPHPLFKRTVEHCTAETAALFESLTPHKMFRRAFLLEHGIEFPEGPVRLEDQLFMARAYVRARSVAILGDRPCYVWNRREDGGNTSSRPTPPEVYYGHLRAVVDAIREGTEPGPLQDRLLRRSYRVELLRPVSEPRVLQRTGRSLERYHGVVRAMALECYPPGVRDGLPAVSRLRASLLEAGRLDSLVELARRVREIRPQVTVDDVGWHDGGLLVATTVGLRRPDGEPLVLVEREGRLLLDPELLAGIPGAEGWAVPDPLGHADGELIVHDLRRKLWWFPDAELAPRVEPLGGGRYRVVVSGKTLVDPAALAGGGPLEPGPHQLWVRAQLLGVGRRTPLADVSHRPRLPAATVAEPPRLIVPGWSGPHSALRLAVARPHATGPLHRLLLRVTAAPRLRRTALALIRRLPSGARHHVRRLARRADPWTVSAHRSGDRSRSSHQ